MTRRARRERETMEYLGFASRAIAAAGRRVGDADEFELAELVALRAVLEEAILTGIQGQRARGRSWAHIGDALGITRQAAQERYTPKRPAAPKPFVCACKGDGCEWCQTLAVAS
ncbi:hypothetical protein [Microbacterium kyungheense]|uniref:Sigma-70-like protein n=1 Tax=Microbacterium kyungheense TaxID=1263636 RepID=A0A543EU85_9MICO|nr:hypothetical protein [Microbacterium kyungheense]TQM25126.1 hypothetical protein FB391_2585 [Microbacterium kyungheense]